MGNHEFYGKVARQSVQEGLDHVRFLSRLVELELTLREDARWSNGDPVTAHDFVYAWRRAADPATASPYAWYLELTEMVNAKAILAGEKPPAELGVRAVADHSLEVKLNTPLPYFPAMTTYATLFPAHRATVEAHGADWTAPGNMASNGAYVLEEVVLNEYHSRVRNPMYWGADEVIIEKVTGLVINDVNQALTRYRAGELDHLEPLPPGQYPALKEELPDEAASVPRLCSYHYAFNHTGSGNPERIVADDMAIVPIYHYANTFLLAADIRGWPYDNVENNWYSKNLYRVAN